MKLALEFIDNNPFSFCGIYIKNSSPKIWAIEITRMKLDLKECVIYPCPGLDANSVSGILILSKTINRSIEIGEHTFVQEAHQRLFIPENTQLSAALTNNEVDELFNKQFHFFHHQLGLIELKESLQWEEILVLNKEISVEAKKPSKGVRIPEEVLSYSVEVEQEEEEGFLENPFKEGINPEDLPFDIKKVLKGNNKEVKKYLAYLERNPEAALKMAIPLDMMGTARGKAYAKLKFGRGLFGSFGLGKFKKGIGRSNTKIGTIFVVFIMVLVIIFLVKFLLTESESSTESSFNWLPIYMVIVMGVIFIGYSIFKKRGKVKAKKTTWSELPDDSEYFKIKDEGAESEFYFGGDEITLIQKIIVFSLLFFLLAYLLYPMFQGNRTGKILSLIIGISMFRMFYKLIRKDEDFFEDES